MILPKLHRLNNLEKTPTTLLVCDLQEKFQPAIKNFSRVSKIVCRLIFACQKFEIKCLVTEQYPKGLGKTDPLIMAALDQSKINHKVIEKTKFSMITDDTISYLNLPATQPSPTEPPTPEPQNFILTGLESHVCVLQTCQDLIALGHHVFLVVDAVESRSQYDKTFAIKRLEKLGVEILTHESLIFDLLGDKNHENFKFCSSLVRELLHE